MKHSRCRPKLNEETVKFRCAQLRDAVQLRTNGDPRDVVAATTTEDGYASADATSSQAFDGSYNRAGGSAGTHNGFATGDPLGKL